MYGYEEASEGEELEHNRVVSQTWLCPQVIEESPMTVIVDLRVYHFICLGCQSPRQNIMLRCLTGRVDILKSSQRLEALTEI